MKELIVEKDPKSPVSEVFRILRTNIQFMNTNKKLKTLLLTSTVSGEGKSLIAANLATTFAQANKKVVLIDCDMRKGRQHNLFNVPSRPGLSNYLSGVDDEGKEFNEELVKYVRETKVEGLYLIPAGDIPPNPSELIASDRMINLLKQLEETCDIIILDGTPSLVVTDAVLLSRIVDSTLIVSSQNYTKIEDLKKVKKDIDNVGGKIAGVVLNKVEVKAKQYMNRYYYYGEKQDGKNNNKGRKKMYALGSGDNRRSASNHGNKETLFNKEEVRVNNNKQTTQEDLAKTNEILNSLNNYVNSEKNKLNRGQAND